MVGRIENLVEDILTVSVNWIIKGNDGLDRFIDPNDNVEISDHYGATHMAASLILWGKYTLNNNLYNKGISLLRSILARWNVNKNLPTFHFDFNNFALVLVESVVDNETKLLIKDVVCQTSDSNHNTINWLPMRWVVNLKRLEWTNNCYYRTRIEEFRRLINKATNEDGGIEDRLPYGMSFNLQYDIATVAVMQYLNVHGEEINLSKQLGFLLNAVAPDGDINYQGRGTNQIFAWGLWVYLLSSSNHKHHLEQALDYLTPRLHIMLQLKSMMLNEWPGKEKYLWWDYHYASVYTAHCLLWLILAVRDYKKSVITPSFSNNKDTGLYTFSSPSFFVNWFAGRDEYLAERGPAIAAIWTQKQGMICKGTFAPWQGNFGSRYIYDDIVLKNYCGLISVKHNKDWSKNRLIHKVLPQIKNTPICIVEPLFLPVQVLNKKDCVEIVWENTDKNDFFFNFPSLKKDCDIKLFVDEFQVNLFCSEAIKNQYGWVFLYQSRRICGKNVKLVIY